ncbi:MULTISPECIES: glycosyltransferase [Streptomyces]|uniref:Glycosyl transferase n=2 Tax=Streptomyces TaxID=1883 RepID=A0A2U9P9K1_STRAS|nr:MULTISPECIES: glycosyltransferase [Streptomyces]AWT46193.1 glycosyl transferase [Streptomyces actuosus]MBM4822861.1 glycosyltransferase [Streptomyces actuosus]GHF46469.1 glycosyl transferase [Streptomyces griseosporeus]
MRILIWHVHGSWTTAFVQGPHTYVVPVTPDRGPDGLGRARTFDWPDSVIELPPEQLRDAGIDLVVLQRPHELALVDAWLGRRPPLVYLEHNAPHGDVPDTRHPAAGLPVAALVHVTHFNRLMWDNGRAPATVIEHGIVDPGPRWTGELPHAAVVVNDPVRRGRTTGTDLLADFARVAPLDVFGMRTDQLDVPGVTTHDLVQADLHTEMARRRLYLHPVRWTSLGLSLLEAMHLAMPVVALATTEVAEAVPPGAGVVSNRPDVLHDAVRDFVADPPHARAVGESARAAALARYGLTRFLDDWERLLKEVTR